MLEWVSWRLEEGDAGARGGDVQYAEARVRIERRKRSCYRRSQGRAMVGALVFGSWR